MQCQLVQRLFEAMQAIHREQSVARDYGGGAVLYHSEISLLQVIRRNPERSGAALAEVLGITNGALTQTARKLIDKGLIEQYAPPRNRKLKYHRLTERGEQALAGHAAYHKDDNARLLGYLCSRPPEEKRVLMEFLGMVTDCRPVCLCDCACEAEPCACLHEQGGSADAGA